MTKEDLDNHKSFKVKTKAFSDHSQMPGSGETQVCTLSCAHVFYR